MSDADSGDIKGLLAGRVGSVKFGRGVIGKSAYLLGTLLLGIIYVIGKTQSTPLLVFCLLLLVGSYFTWLHLTMKLARDKPASILLEGAEWADWSKFEATSKHRAAAETVEVIAEADEAPVLPAALPAPVPALPTGAVAEQVVVPAADGGGDL